MIFDCPQCKARLRGGEPGSVVACGRCANSVVVPATPRTEAEAAPPEAPAPAAVATARSPWATAAVVLGLVALAHLGLFLLLTLDARAQRREIRSRYPVAALRSAPKPDPSPAPGTPAFKTWRRAHDLWIAAEEHRRHESHIGLLRDGFLFSFLVQLAITAWILVRVLERRRRAARAGSAG